MDEQLEGTELSDEEVEAHLLKEALATGAAAAAVFAGTAQARIIDPPPTGWTPTTQSVELQGVQPTTHVKKTRKARHHKTTTQHEQLHAQHPDAIDG